MAHENESIHGTFHLKLNLAITGEFEDLETICEDKVPIKHDVMDCANNLLQVTVGWIMPKKRQTIKKDLEMIHKRFPKNLNVIANLISVYNSLLLVKKSEELHKILRELTQSNLLQDNLCKCQALAERAYVLVGDVASQEKTDDIEKLKLAIDWFEKAIRDGKPQGMTEDECFIWKFFLAKTRYRLQKRYKFDQILTEETSKNFVQMLTEFAEIYEAQVQQPPGQSKNPPESPCTGDDSFRDSEVVYSHQEATSEVSDFYSYLKALALAYLVAAFSIKNAADKGKKVPKWTIPESFIRNETLQQCHTDPYKAYDKASKLSHNYKIENRFARALMNWGGGYFEQALNLVSESIESTRRSGKIKSNWFGYATCFQIHCKQYLFSLQQAKGKCTNLQERKERFQDAKCSLRQALKYIDDCPYRSASTLLDIANIYYYLGVDPETEVLAEETDLENSIEYLMMARERVEGYKNPQTHARLARCLWELGNWRPAIECMKLAIGMEHPGYTKNFIKLCKYVLVKSQDIAAKDIAAIHESGKEKYKDITHDEELKEYLAKLKIYSDTENPFPNENSWQDYNDPPTNAKNNGYTHDFIILNAYGNMGFAAKLLRRLENEQPTPYKGRHSILFY